MICLHDISIPVQNPKIYLHSLQFLRISLEFSGKSSFKKIRMKLNEKEGFQNNKSFRNELFP